MVAEIDTIKKRIAEEVPPPGVLYYKYKAKDGSGEDENQIQQEDGVVV